MQTTQLRFCDVCKSHPETLPEDHLPPPVPVDVTKGETLAKSLPFENANAVVSLVGIVTTALHPSSKQSNGRERRMSHGLLWAVAARSIYMDTIGADLHGKIPNARKKASSEETVRFTVLMQLTYTWY